MEGNIRRVRDSCKEAGILEAAVVQGLGKFAKYILSEGKYEQRQRSELSNSEHCRSEELDRKSWGRGPVHEAMLRWPLAFLNPPDPCVEVTLALCWPPLSFVLCGG